MTQKQKLGIGAAVFVVMIVIAAGAYNKLGGLARHSNTLVPVQEQDEASAVTRQKAPDFTMTDRNGNSTTLSTIIANGKPVVLNFWASWCPPCKVEMPDFDKVYQEIGGEVQFLMLDLVDGLRETTEKGVQYVAEQEFSFPVYFDTSQEAAYTYGIRSIPTTLFIDKDGYVVTGAQGAIDERTLRRGIELVRGAM